MSERRCADAAPCQVVVAEFVFDAKRCGQPAMYEVEWDGWWWRICDEHRRPSGSQGGQP